MAKKKIINPLERTIKLSLVLKDQNSVFKEKNFYLTGLCTINQIQQLFINFQGLSEFLVHFCYGRKTVYCVP